MESCPSSHMPLKVSDIRAGLTQVLTRFSRHWRFISCYHGYWLQMTIESMQTMAHINFNASRPAPIHPGSFFDLVKIRSLVGEAVEVGVKAAGIDSRRIRALYRKKACNRLAQAYRLDEVASSVAVMQETSSLEDAGRHVLESERDGIEESDLVDAKYVHFFEERIPSRQVAEFTNCEVLNSIIESRMMMRDRAHLPGTFRTRAIVKAFKGDHEGAAADLREALNYHHADTKGGHTALALGPETDLVPKQRKEDIELPPEEQPSSIEPHLLFQRAGMLLSIACKYLQLSMPSRSGQNGKVKDIGSFTEDAPELDPPVLDASGPDPNSEDAQTTEARIQVKKHARLAQKDYMAYLNLLEYTPNLPKAATTDYTRRIGAASRLRQTLRQTRTPDSGIQYSNKIYKLSDLFREVVPNDLPEWPAQDMVKGAPAPDFASKETFEALTFHPLLGEALHCLLLCHCLMQTPTTELVRYAYMASRLYTISNPWPLFQPSRSPARADWIEILETCNGKIHLCLPWEVIAPYPPVQPLAKPTAPQRPLTPPNLIEKTEIEVMKERVGGSGDGDMVLRNGKDAGQAGSGGARAVTAARIPPGRWQPTVDTTEIKDYRPQAGRGEYIARWVNEVPFVKMPKAKKKRP